MLYEVITDSEGCIGKSTTENFTVHPLPEVLVNNYTICSGDSLTLAPAVSKGTGSYTDYLWKGAGEILDDSTKANPDVANQTPGIYKVKLVVTDSIGCVGESKAANIVINELPTAILHNQETCYGTGINVKSSVLDGDENYTYAWIDDAGILADTTAIIPSLANINQADSVYGIALKVTDGNGCISQTTRKTITIHPEPVVDILTDGTQGCSPFNTSLRTSEKATSYYWNFGDRNNFV